MINEWLQEFKTGWITKDIDRVMNLFTENIQYWETPFKKLDNKYDVRNEWQAIKNQINIDINLSVYAMEANKHTVVWNLAYTDSEATIQNWAGTYLIELNENGKCDYFYQAGERRG